MARHICVIKYKEELVLSDKFREAYWNWAVCRPSASYDEVLVKKITKEKAQQIIEDYKLTLAFRNEDGKVYDSPQKDFQRAYGGLPIIIPRTF